MSAYPSNTDVLIPKLIKLYQSISQFAAIIVFLIAIVVIFGWLVDIATLQSILPNTVGMKANTAIAFILTSLAIWSLQSKRVILKKIKFAQGIAFLVLLIGVLTLIEYMTGWDLRLDQLLFREESGVIGTSHPGRMAPNTAINFVIIGLALILQNVRVGKTLYPSQYLILLEGVISFMAFMGYLYGVPILYGLIPSLTVMAANTSVAFLLVFLAVFLARPDLGMVAIFSSRRMGGVLARRLVIPAIIAPPVLELIVHEGEKIGFYNFETAQAVHASLVSLVFLIIVLTLSNFLDRVDLERHKANRELKDLNVSLETKVAERTTELAHANETLRAEITERNQAEKALRESERKFKNLIEGVPIGISISTPDGNVTESNTNLWKLFGYASKEEFMVVPAISHYYDPEERKRFVAKLIKEGSVTDFETRYKRKDGAVFWGSVTSMLQKNPDEQSIFINTFKDITLQKLAADELRLHSQIMSYMEEGVYLIKASDGTIVYANPKFEKMFGYQHGELIGNPVTIVNAPTTKSPEDTAREISEILHKTGTWTGEVYNAKKDGTQFWCHATVSTFDHHEYGTVWISIHQDITEKKQAEDEINNLNKELEQRVVQRTAKLEIANKELESFSYSVAHDLRAPLRSINGFSQALLEDYAEKFDEQGRDYIGRVRQASKYMGQLIDDLLKLSHVTRSEIQLDIVDLSQIANNIVAELRRGETGRRVKFTINNAVIANGDRRLLRILMESLLDNAWKFTSKKSEAKIEFGTSAMDGEEVYFVRDNGAGFDMKYVDKLFVPFHRLHSPVQFPGAGIGLTTAQHVINGHGGKIWAEGEVDKGATFYFTLAGAAKESDVGKTYH